MDFASSFIYQAPKEEYEFVSDEEFQGGMNLSGSSSESESEDLLELGNSSRWKRNNASATKSKHHWRKHQSAPEQEATAKSKRWFRKADTNVVSVSFDTLVSACDTHAGDPVVCDQCQAILSNISKPCLENNSMTWQCEFCGHSMPVDVAPEEIPTTEEVTFLLEPSMTATSTNELGRDESLVVFCVDTSGSMCVTSEVEGKIKLRGSSHQQLRRMDSFNTEGDNQYLPSQRRDVTYVSRLEAMQTAVEHQLLEMTKRYPYRRVALVAFNNHVRVVGDGLQDEITVAGDKLGNLDQLTEIGSQVPSPQSVQQSYLRLSKKVNELEEGGATALGPALVVAVNMAASCAGSKVILCTDGKANIGLGNLEEEDEETGKAFYSTLGDMAVSKCVSISVTTIEGTDCKLVHLGQLADKTGGQVNIVDPLNLVKEFGSILSEDFLATNVKAKFLVHKDLYILDETDPDKKLCCSEFCPGNVQRNTVFTFAFARRFTTPKELEGNKEGDNKMPGDDSNKTDDTNTQQTDKDIATDGSPPLPVPARNFVSLEQGQGDSRESTVNAAGAETPPEFPFQVQIEYVDRQGARALKVITQTRPATDNRQVAESKANLEVLGTHAAKQSADLALQGEYTQSRGRALMTQRLAWRSSHSDSTRGAKKKLYKNVCHRLKTIENQLQQKQSREILVRGRTYSDDENDDSMDDDVDGLLEHDGPSAVKACMPASSCPPAASRQKAMRPAHRQNKKKLAVREIEMGDSFANMAFNLRRTSHQDFQSQPTNDTASGGPEAIAEEGNSNSADQKKPPRKKRLSRIMKSVKQTVLGAPSPASDESDSDE